MRSLLLVSLLFITATPFNATTSLRRSRRHRSLQAPYFSTTDLGTVDVAIAAGNPLKGLVGGSVWSNPPLDETIPLSMEWFNVGLKEVMIGDNAFNWDVVDDLLDGSASRKKHAAFSFFIDWGGQFMSLPDFLDGNVVTYDLVVNNTVYGTSIGYGDEVLLAALDQFIAALGAKYNGDPRVAAVHLGLLGFWGEFHVYPYENEDIIVPESSMVSVSQWFQAAFPDTQLQARYPETYTTNMGFYDGSFTKETIGGVHNAGETPFWYFLEQLETAGKDNVWRTHMIAGETYPDYQDRVFTSNFGGVYGEQDFLECVRQTHASWVVHHNAFSGQSYQGTELDNAMAAHALLGYNFVVNQVQLFYDSNNGWVDMEVTLSQVGVAPFYYDLSLQVECYDLGSPLVVSNIQTDLIAEGDTHSYLVSGLPSTSQCVQAVSVKLVSSMLYSGTSIKFAQGDGAIVLDLPLPPGVEPTPTIMFLPSAAPSMAPSASVGPFDVLYTIPGDMEPTSYFQVSSQSVYCDGNAQVSSGAYNPDIFECHRWGWGQFSYTITGLNPAAVHPLRLGFAEIYGPNCNTGARVFSVTVNDKTFVDSLDPFATAGCLTAHLVDRYVTTNEQGELVIEFQSSQENPFVSLIVLGVEDEETTSPTPSPSSTPSLLPSTTPSSAPVTTAPRAVPSREPSTSPTVAPSFEPSASPITSSPSATPSSTPSLLPSTTPSSAPVTTAPSTEPSAVPSREPSSSPTVAPSFEPSASPVTSRPRAVPSSTPSLLPRTTPSSAPVTTAPSSEPSAVSSREPSSSPTVASSAPSFKPSASPITSIPSGTPSVGPTAEPIDAPTTNAPSLSPITSSPSASPSATPSSPPIGLPSSLPTESPRSPPTSSPTGSPISSSPTMSPVSSNPTRLPTMSPISNSPTPEPTQSAPSWESLVIPGVSSAWHTVALTGTFVAPVVVCSVQYASSADVPAVVRLRNVGVSSFEVRLQNPGELSSVSSRTVHCVSVDEGVWQLPDGRVVEAVRYLSSGTSSRSSWGGANTRSYSYSGFSTPIVIGQVMSYNDPGWSTFWARGNRRQNSPSSGDLRTGKHKGEDTSSRGDETVGYIVMEGGLHSVVSGDVEIESNRGGDSIRGFLQGSYQYNFVSSFASGGPAVTVISQSAMDGTDGSWAVLTASATSSSFGLAVDEDQIRDTDRSHTTEAVDYIAVSQQGILPLSPL